VEGEHRSQIRTMHHENVVWPIPSFTIHVDFSKPKPSGKVCITLLRISTSSQDRLRNSCYTLSDPKRPQIVETPRTALTFHCMLPVPSSPMFVHCTASGWYTSQALPIHCS
jgi:hypothetical protein